MTIRMDHGEAAEVLAAWAQAKFPAPNGMRWVASVASYSTEIELEPVEPPEAAIPTAVPEPKVEA